jgi:hypothetical protein
MIRFLALNLVLLVLTSGFADAQQGPPPAVPPFLQPPPNPASPAAAGQDGGSAPAKAQNRRARFSSDVARRCRTEGLLICDLAAPQPSGSACTCRSSPGSQRTGTAIP